MPFSLRHFCALSFLWIFALSSCTKKNPFDTEGILGKSEKTFYKASTSTSAIAIVTAGPGQKTTRFQIESGIAAAPTSIDPATVSFSADKNLITLANEAGIYEYAPASIADVTSGKTPLPQSKVDTYCTDLSPAGYTDFRVLYTDTSYQFVAVNGLTQESVGGNGSVVKNATALDISYTKDGFGTLQINPTSPSAEAPFFYTSSFLNAPSPWSSVTGILCHLNNVPVGPPIASATPSPTPSITPTHRIFVSTTAFTGSFNGGGPALADSTCQTEGTTQFGADTHWIALYSTSRASAASRITIDGTFVDTRAAAAGGSQTIASNLAALWSGTLLNPPQYSKDGALQNTIVLTGTTAFGGLYSGNNCLDWTSANSSDNVAMGATTATNTGWTDALERGCFVLRPVYCVEQ